MEKEQKYITFALPLVRQIYTDPHAIDKIVVYGLYRASIKIKADRMAAYRQLMYMAGRHPEQVPEYLKDEVESFLDADPAECMSELYSIEGEAITPAIVEEFAESAEDSEEEICEWYKVYLAQEVVGATARSLPNVISLGRELSELYGTGQVPVSVATCKLFDLRDAVKSEYSKVRVCMYIAIRSIAGAGVGITTTKAIIWRMFGAKNEQELQEVLRDKKIKSIYETWTTKRKIRNLLNDLIASNMIREMPYHRRICVSASILEEKAFVEAVASKIRNMTAKRRNATARQQRERLSGMLKDAINSP